MREGNIIRPIPPRALAGGSSRPPAKPDRPLALAAINTRVLNGCIQMVRSQLSFCVLFDTELLLLASWCKIKTLLTYHKRIGRKPRY